MFETIKEDLAAFVDVERFAPRLWLKILHPRFHPLVLLRTAGFFTRIGLRPVGRIFSYLNLVLFGADIGLGARIGGGLMIPHPVGIAIGKYAVVGRRCTIHQGVTLGSRGAAWKESDHPVIGDRVQLSTGAKILGGIKIGDGAIVAANAVVLADVEPGCVAAGVPARVIRRPDSAAAGRETGS